jgi:GNAT superfamily N-acetyltransferase
MSDVGAGGDVLCVETIRVLERYRRRGVGRLIVRVVCEQAERVGTKHIILIPMDIDDAPKR